mmetsp:Transcript_8034/g.7603  ORF Transcript_8034/g.7603 Transcript_8034/m.7603 type:complete len:101 (+) Transcript_8034:88-390(+)
MKLLDWSHNNFKETITTDTTVSQLKKVLEQKHSHVKNFILCKEEFRETHEMLDDKKTLKDYGINGSIDDKESAPSVTICYNFTPMKNKEGKSDPLLLSWT